MNHRMYLKKSNSHFEDFVGIFECVEGLSSDSLVKYTNDILLRSQLDGIKMVAIAFDGANAMKSLSRKIKDSVAPNAIFIYTVLPIAMT